MVMKVQSLNLRAMSVDKLSDLRDEIDALLSAKAAEERRSAQEQLARLDRLMGGTGRGKKMARGPRGPVAPKYRNPDNPAETWAGRGLKPRWIAAALKSGRKLEEFSIDARPKKTRTAAKKVRAKGKA